MRGRPWENAMSKAYLSQWLCWGSVTQAFVHHCIFQGLVSRLFLLQWKINSWCHITYREKPSSLENAVQLSRSAMSDSLQPHGLQHARTPCPSPTTGVYSNSCPLSRWYHPTISSSVIPFSSRLESFPASGSFPVSQFFASSNQRIGVSASTSVLPMNIQDWFPLGWTGWISLLSRGLSRVFFNTTVQKCQFFGAQLSL